MRSTSGKPGNSPLKAFWWLSQRSGAGDGRTSVVFVEEGANQAKQHFERIQAAGSVLEALFPLSKRIVEGVREVEGRRFVGCDCFLDAFPKREFSPGNPSGCFQTVEAFVVATHEDVC